MSTILIIDDEEHILRMLEMNVRNKGYSCLTALSGEEGLSLAFEHLPDLILLDVMLPGISGVEVCRQLKEDSRTRRIPVVMLSAKSEGKDKIKGLLGGADDYITKPFSIEELFLRIAASLRQVDILTGNTQPVIFSVGSLTLNTGKYQLHSNGIKIDLTLTEFRILHKLMEKKETIISRETLIREIIGKEPEDSGRTLDVHIRNIRRKFSDAEVQGCRIETLRGSGLKISEIP